MDDQVKLGGRRVELGEIDAALLAAAAAVRETEAGGQLLVGYLVLDEAAATGFDPGAAREVLADRVAGRPRQVAPSAGWPNSGTTCSRFRSNSIPTSSSWAEPA